MGQSLQAGHYLTSSRILPASLRDSHARLRQGLIIKWQGNTLILRTHILKLDRPEFKFWLYYLSVMWSWICPLIALSLNFLIFKMEMTVSIKQDNAYKVLRRVPDT